MQLELEQHGAVIAQMLESGRHRILRETREELRLDLETDASGLGQSARVACGV